MMKTGLVLYLNGNKQNQRAHDYTNHNDENYLQEVFKCVRLSAFAKSNASLQN